MTRIDPLPFTPDDFPFGSPVSAAKVDRVLRLLDLSPASRLIDVGCGNAELLVRAGEQYGAGGVGVDRDPAAMRDGRERVASRAPGAGVTLHETDAARFNAGTLFDVAICIGATHIYGGFPATLRALSGLTRPGGSVVVGDIYWKREPAAEYLAVLGEKASDHLDHHGNVRAGVAQGLTPLYAVVSSDDDWDHFEGRFWTTRLKRPADPDEDPVRAKAERERILAWQDAYLRWGRQTTGFGLYLFRT